MTKTTLLSAAALALVFSSCHKGRINPDPHPTPGCGYPHEIQLQGSWYWLSSTETASGKVSTADQNSPSVRYVFNPDNVFVEVTGSDSVASTYTRDILPAEQAVDGVRETVVLDAKKTTYYVKYTEDTLWMKSMGDAGTNSVFVRVKPAMW